MSTRAEIIEGRRTTRIFEAGDLVRFDAPRNMEYIVMVTRDVQIGDDQFQGVTLTTNGLNLIGEHGSNYVLDQFIRFKGTIQLTSE